MLDRRHVQGPGGSNSHQNHQERRQNHGLTNPHSSDRRHMSGLSDRRHISPPLHINICDNSASLHALSPQPSELRRNHLSPAHLQHSPPYFRQPSNNGDDGIKSESPSRKRRRLSRSGHHQIMDMGSNSRQEHQHRRSPRQHNHVPQVPNHNHNHNHNQPSLQGSPPLRRTR